MEFKYTRNRSPRIERARGGGGRRQPRSCCRIVNWPVASRFAARRDGERNDSAPKLNRRGRRSARERPGRSNGEPASRRRKLIRDSIIAGDGRQRDSSWAALRFPCALALRTLAAATTARRPCVVLAHGELNVRLRSPEVLTAVYEWPHARNTDTGQLAAPGYLSFNYLRRSRRALSLLSRDDEFSSICACPATCLYLEEGYASVYSGNLSSFSRFFRRTNLSLVLIFSENSKVLFQGVC